MKLLQLTIVLAIGLIASFASDLKAQDTLVLNTGKAYVATVTDVRESYIKYKNYPEGDEAAEILDIRALKEIRFADGNRMVFNRAQNQKPTETKVAEYNKITDVELYVTDFGIKPPSYYLEQSANYQYGAIGMAAASGLFALLGSRDTVTTNSNDLHAPKILYGFSIAFGVTAIVLEFVSISNLKKAGKSLERIHLRGNGIAIDL